MFPQQVFANNSATPAQSFAFQSNLAFAPATGVYGSSTVFTGPLAGSIASGQTWRVNSAKVVVTPIISMTNSQGNAQMTYFQDPINSTMGNTSNPNIPQSTLPLTAFYQSGNLVATYSSLRLPIDDHDDDFFPDNQNSTTFDDGTPSNDEGFYLLITGGPVSATIAKIDYYINGEFLPAQGNLPTSILDTSEPGPVTAKCIATLVLRQPRLQSCSLKEAEQLCNVVDATPGHFNAIIDAVCEKATTFAALPPHNVIVSGAPQYESMSLVLE